MSVEMIEENNNSVDLKKLPKKNFVNINLQPSYRNNPIKSLNTTI